MEKPKPVKALSGTTQVMAKEGLITRAQLAHELGMSPQTIALWEKKGMPVLRIGMQRFYDSKNVAAWMRETGKEAA